MRIATILFQISVLGVVGFGLQAHHLHYCRDPTPDVGVFPELHPPGCVDNSKSGIVSVAFRFGVAAACAPDGAMSTWPCLN